MNNNWNEWAKAEVVCRQASPESNKLRLILITTPKSKKQAAEENIPSTYSGLRTAVRQALALGKTRALQAVEREKVRTSWEVGKLILEHVLLNQDRADYGSQTVSKLSKDLSVSKTQLWSMIEFAREYPILPTARQLSWSHYRVLLGVNDVQERNRLTAQSIKNNWSYDQLSSEVKKAKSTSKTSVKPESLKKLKPGALDVFRTRVVNGKAFIDLGFSTYLLKSTVKQKLKVVKNKNFTYRAEVEAVVDGDTIWCLVDLGLGVNTRQKLRLAHIDAPELISKDGIAAKKFLSKKLSKGSEIIIATTKSDKFDRYLVDVFVGEEYVNQTLVEEGYAMPVGR